MRTAFADLDLDRLWVLHAGKERIRLTKEIEALPLRQIGELPPL
jgi:hypothetical protein